jgi:hypothetical protein
MHDGVSNKLDKIMQVGRHVLVYISLMGRHLLVDICYCRGILQLMQDWCTLFCTSCLANETRVHSTTFDLLLCTCCKIKHRLLCRWGASYGDNCQGGPSAGDRLCCGAP